MVEGSWAFRFGLGRPPAHRRGHLDDARQPRLANRCPFFTGIHFGPDRGAEDEDENGPAPGRSC